MAVASSPSRRRAERAFQFEGDPECAWSCSLLGSAPLRILDISQYGMRVALGTARHKLDRSQMIEGSLTLGTMFYLRIQARVVHVDSEAVGLEFIEPQQWLKAVVRVYFKHELLGASMRREPSSGSGKLRLAADPSNWMELEFDSATGSLRRWAVELPALEMSATSTGEPLLQGGATRRALEGMTSSRRAKLLRLVRNLGALDAKEREALESAISAS
jgi:hypothetical protein